MRDFKQAYVNTDVNLAELAENIGFQVGKPDGPAYDEILKFIREIDENIADSEFTRELFYMAEVQLREVHDTRVREWIYDEGGNAVDYRLQEAD